MHFIYIYAAEIFISTHFRVTVILVHLILIGI